MIHLCGENEMSNTFHSPCCISFSGMSGSGKTTLLFKILKDRNILFTSPPEKIMYCYGVWQEMFDSMERELPIEFVEGLPTKAILDKFADGTNKCIVLDDLMSDVVKSIDMQHIFTRGSHHNNLTVIYLNQNMYCQGKFSRTLSLNTQYIFILSERYHATNGIGEADRCGEIADRSVRRCYD